MYIEQLQFTIAAGETKRFETQGRYFELIEANNAVSVVFGEDAGGQAGRLVNVLSGTYVNAPFKGFELFSATAQSIKLLLTDGSGGSRRQPGVVQVVDTERQKSFDGVAFRATDSQAGGGAGVARLQLWNPVGSGKNIIVTGVTVAGSAADVYAIHTTTQQAPNLNGNGLSLDNTGATSSAQVRAGNDATVYPQRNMATGYVQASQDREVQFKRPVLLRPNAGLGVFLATVANNLRATFEFEEYGV